MALRKLLSETMVGVLAHYLAIGIVALVSIGLPAWGMIADHWSWPFALAVGVVLLAAVLSIYRALSGQRVNMKIPTQLRLQMTPGSAIEIGKDNIWYWYALTFSREKHFNDKKEIVRDVPGHLIFMVFDKPVDMKQPIVECPGATFPFFEEKSRSARHLLLECNDEVTNKVVNIRLALPD